MGQQGLPPIEDNARGCPLEQPCVVRVWAANGYKYSLPPAARGVLETARQNWFQSLIELHNSVPGGIKRIVVEPCVDGRNARRVG
jgi:hypothetical protein